MTAIHAADRSARADAFNRILDAANYAAEQAALNKMTLTLSLTTLGVRVYAMRGYLSDRSHHSSYTISWESVLKANTNVIITTIDAQVMLALMRVMEARPTLDTRPQTDGNDVSEQIAETPTETLPDATH